MLEEVRQTKKRPFSHSIWCYKVHFKIVGEGAPLVLALRLRFKAAAVFLLLIVEAKGPVVIAKQEGDPTSR